MEYLTFYGKQPINNSLTILPQKQLAISIIRMLCYIWLRLTTKGPPLILCLSHGNITLNACIIKTRTSLTLNEKKDRDGKIEKVTFYCTEKESRGGKVLKI
jgi:hypothetical protein